MTYFQNHTFHVIWSKDDQEYVGLCTEFPSLSYLHADQDSALQGIENLVKTAVEDRGKNGETLLGG
jgi:hypothetical protein